MFRGLEGREAEEMGYSGSLLWCKTGEETSMYSSRGGSDGI